MDEGIITISSAHLEPINGDIFVRAGSVLPLADNGMHVENSLDTFSGAALMLNAYGNGHSYVYGSAAMIAPGIALTAGHVLQQHFDDNLFSAPDAALFAIGMIDGAIQLWSVISSRFSPKGDAAVLFLAYRGEPSSKLTVCHFTTSVRFPSIGERVTAIGFRPKVGKQAIEQPGQLPSIAGTFLRSSGPVLETWMDGRDRILAPRPCFAAQIATVGAMSGGPVFNEEGHVIGLVTSSFDGADFYTVATMNWDVMLMDAAPVWPPNYYPLNRLVKTLVKPNESERLGMTPDREKWLYQC